MTNTSQTRTEIESTDDSILRALIVSDRGECKLENLLSRHNVEIHSATFDQRLDFDLQVDLLCIELGPDLTFNQDVAAVLRRVYSEAYLVTMTTDNPKTLELQARAIKADYHMVLPCDESEIIAIISFLSARKDLSISTSQEAIKSIYKGEYEMHTKQNNVNREGKYLTFKLGHEEYGINILGVKEIIGMMPITSIPQAPVYAKGVINLRGKIIPVYDLRLMFNMEERPYNDRTSVVVVETDGVRCPSLVGIIVDAVSEVLNIKEADTEDTPYFGGAINREYIQGIAKTEKSVKILIDINRIVKNDEINTDEVNEWDMAS